jgi:hypothetical protein
MRTNTAPWDYRRRMRATEEILAAEKRINAWTSELLGYLRRGLITNAEMWRLTNEGPPAQAHRGAAIAAECGVPVDAG